MTRSDAVLAIISAGPDRSWSPAQVSQALGWPLGKAAGPMRILWAKGKLLRSKPDWYHLPTWKRRPSRAGQRLASLPQDLPRLSPAATAPDPTHLALVINTLHAHRRPMSQTMLLGRLNGHGLKLSALQRLLAALERTGEVRATPGCLYELISATSAR